MIDPGELNKWILLQKQNPDSEEWADVAHLRARVNKTNGGILMSDTRRVSRRWYLSRTCIGSSMLVTTLR